MPRRRSRHRDGRGPGDRYAGSRKQPQPDPYLRGGLGAGQPGQQPDQVGRIRSLAEQAAGPDDDQRDQQEQPHQHQAAEHAVRPARRLSQAGCSWGGGSAGGRVRPRHDPDRHARRVRGDARGARGRARDHVPDRGHDRPARTAAGPPAARPPRGGRGRRRPATGSGRSTPTTRCCRRPRSRARTTRSLPYDGSTAGCCWSPASTRPTPSSTSTTSGSTSTTSRARCGGPARPTCCGQQGASVYVGDHVHDVEGALAAGITSVSVLTGGCTEDGAARGRHPRRAPGPDGVPGLARRAPAGDPAGRARGRAAPAPRRCWSRSPAAPTARSCWPRPRARSDRTASPRPRRTPVRCRCPSASPRWSSPRESRRHGVHAGDRRAGA